LRAYLADNPLRRVAIGGERPSNPGRPWRHLSAHQDLEGVQRSAQGTKLDRIKEVLECWPDRVFAFDEFGSLVLHPFGGCCWAARTKPQRLRGNYRKTCGVRCR
jgi:hypothetical protein